MLHDMFDGYTRSILVFTGVNIIAAYSFYAPFKTGQVSLGQAGFMAIGAYASAILTQKFGVPFAAALPVAGVAAGIIGVLVGFPALRIKGIYLLLLTLGFSEIVQVITLSWDFIGGAQGFRQIPFIPSILEYVVVLIVVLVLFFARLERSSLGRAMDAVHQDETAAEVMGLDVVRLKLLAFGLVVYGAKRVLGGLRPEWVRLGRIVLAAAGAAIVLALVPSTVSVWARIAIGAAVYGVGALLLGATDAAIGLTERSAACFADRHGGTGRAQRWDGSWDRMRSRCCTLLVS